MAVQKRKKSRSRRDMRRSHDHLTNAPIAVDFLSGEFHLRHHATESGYYRGRKVFEPPQTSSEDDSEN